MDETSAKVFLDKMLSKNCFDGKWGMSCENCFDWKWSDPVREFYEKNKHLIDYMPYPEQGACHAVSLDASGEPLDILIKYSILFSLSPAFENVFTFSGRKDEEIALRMMSLISSVAINKLREGDLSGADWDLIVGALNALSNTNCFLEQCETLSFEVIEKGFEKIAKPGERAAVLIDMDSLTNMNKYCELEIKLPDFAEKNNVLVIRTPYKGGA